MQQRPRRKGKLAFEDALEEIAKLPAPQRRQLCKAAVTYFSSPAAIGMMDMLGSLPENHPRKLINTYRVAYALLRLLEHGILPQEVLELELAIEEWHKLEPI